uniref:Putative secreted protein n=1 Tax=Xenopsylla cheopis TaxID=163159 RepID=A0A6M2DUM9_XENCH
MSPASTSLLVLLACAFSAEAQPLTAEQVAILSRALESELPVSNEINSIYDDISEHDKEDLLANKHRLLERLKEISRQRGYEADHSLGVAPIRDTTLHRESRRQQGPYMTLCHFKICNMGKKRSQHYNAH